MAQAGRRRIWSSLAAVALVGTLLSLRGTQSSLAAANVTPCDQVLNNSCEVGLCPDGQLCRPDNGGCHCVPGGCCEIGNNARGRSAEVGSAGFVVPCTNQLTEDECEAGQGAFFADSSCTVDGCTANTPTSTPDSTATSTPESTPTATPTNTPRLPDGDVCDDPMDCLSGNCVDDVCCDTACDDPLESCNQPGNVGTCSPIRAPAPAASSTGMLLIIGSLIAVAAVALLRRRAS